MKSISLIALALLGPVMAVLADNPGTLSDSGAPPDGIVLQSTGGSRIKDLAMVEGARDNQLTGYGLVVGLAGVGDSKLVETAQSIRNVLERHGVNVSTDDIKSNNVAAVMITAEIGPFARPGSRIDVTVSSIGDAKTLQGGVLLQVPLLGADGVVYAVAQGPVAIGGFLAGEGGGGGATVQKNHPTVGTISNGALVERTVPSSIVQEGVMHLLLREPDFTSAARMAEAVNQVFPNSSVATDAGTINIKVPAEYVPYEVNFVATLGTIEVVPDAVARVVINERTGTIVATSNVRISKVAISHGSITISITSNLNVSQPAPFAEKGQTVVTPSTNTDVKEQKGGFKIVDEAPTIERVATALNALGVSTHDMIAIFQAMKRAGALQAELVLN